MNLPGQRRGDVLPSWAAPGGGDLCEASGGLPEAGGDSCEGGGDAARVLIEAMGRVAVGDQAAFEVVYTRSWAPVRSRALGVLRDPGLAEEVAQEVMIQVWSQAGRYRPGSGSVMAWILMIAHRRAVDRVRAVEVCRRREQEDLAQRLAGAVEEDVANGVARALEREAVGAAVVGLRPLQRQAVELAFYGGRTSRQIADLLGVPEPTVKSRIRDGLLHLAAGTAGSPRVGTRTATIQNRP